MNDWFVGVLHITVAIFVFCFGWLSSASTIGWECSNMNLFYVGNKVYECKLKEKNG
jgi:hypothetical protein